MTMSQHHRHAIALLRAASVLAEAGRPDSAAALRRGLDQERLLLALAACPAGSGGRSGQLSSEVRVATILDPFSTNSFDGAFHGTTLLPDCWKSQFEETQPQIFFCESAWTGADTEKRPWSGRIHASSRIAQENRHVLLDILAYCRQQGIVTVFWNKEDPTHYGDRVHDFVKTATAFEHVFTTAQECVPQYRADYGLQHVHPLPFATNPSLFSPVETHERTQNVTFAGSWYAHHEERSLDMHRILNGLLTRGFRLEIYDRFHGSSDPKHIWPEAYQPFLHPAVPHADISRIYKASRFGLNINTVTHSQTMFARRVFELMSSHTLVLSNHSLGMEEMFGQDVVFCDKDPARLKSLSSDEIDGMRERNLHLVLEKHTYRRRWEQMLAQIGFPFLSADETVTVIWPMQSVADARKGQLWFRQEADVRRDRLWLICRDDMSARDIETCMALRTDGVTVTTLRDLEQGLTAGPAHCVETSHILLHASHRLPPEGWLGRARLHLQYAGALPLAPAPDGASRYHVLPRPADEPLLVRAGHAMMEDGSRILAV